MGMRAPIATHKPGLRGRSKPGAGPLSPLPPLAAQPGQTIAPQFPLPMSKTLPMK